MTTAFDAIIIGAGPAGSSAAIMLADAGWRVALVEKQAYPRRKVCGECISATNLPILHALGIGRVFSQLAGPPLRQVALVCGARIVRAPLPAYADPVHQWGVALSREHLDTMLLEQARHRGVSVFQPWQACEIAGSPGNFRCRLRTVDRREEQVLVVSLVIDAHGSWEPGIQDGRPQAAWRARPRSSDLFAFKANFVHAALEHGLLPVLSFPGGYGGMVMCSGATATFAFCLRRNVLMQARSQFPGMKTADAANGWVREHSKAAATLLGDAIEHGKWLGAGPIRPGIRLTGRYDAVFAIGNAAGEAHPIIGEGISMALQSAVLLANMLVRGNAHLLNSQARERLSAEYAQAWRRHFARRIYLSALYAHLAMRPQLLSRLLPLLGRKPALLTGFARWCGKVYPGPDLPMETAAARCD